MSLLLVNCDARGCKVVDGNASKRRGGWRASFADDLEIRPRESFPRN